MKKETFRKIDKEVEARQHFQLTRPPRMEGKVKNAMMNPVKKENQWKMSGRKNDSYFQKEKPQPRLGLRFFEMFYAWIF